MQKEEWLIERNSIEKIPLDQDCYLMSDIHMEAFIGEITKITQGKQGNPYQIGAVAYVAARIINQASIELSWYPNTYTRFHEISISLPKDKFVACVECSAYDFKPYIFVNDAWLKEIYSRQYSSFALIDAIGVRQAINDGKLNKKLLLALRDRIDDLAKSMESISFISFADSLILKNNFNINCIENTSVYSYAPEQLLLAIQELDKIYQSILNLQIYAVLTQGSNEYYDEPLLHISKTKNHICLNSLGLPFAELLSIEQEAKKSIKNDVHPPAQLYMDQQFYHSLNFNHEFHKKSVPKNKYKAIMRESNSYYFYSSCSKIIENLDRKIAI